ncbi:hypothetical protein [Brevibacillus migulae]|uniref:hypothetical protein n=1 Tax=Brevibacillus migulae TaxID=1644114 RepID=UPI00106EFE96|nr:hypothetical protein [Brevibacillus migulae]
MKKRIGLEEKRMWLLATVRQLRYVKRHTNATSRLYVRTLAKLAMIELKIEHIEKQKEVRP